MSPFSPLQPGVLKFAAGALADRWPEWDDEAQRFSPGNSTACWPEREVVAAEMLRTLSDAGFAKGVLRSDYADLLDPEKLAAVTADRMQVLAPEPVDLDDTPDAAAALDEGLAGERVTVAWNPFDDQVTEGDSDSTDTKPS